MCRRPVSASQRAILAAGAPSAAAACHGGGARGSKGSEYSTWIAVDPHAKAFQTLFKPESRAMHEKLSGAGVAVYGVSVDSVFSHRAFAQELGGLPYEIRVIRHG